MEDFEHFLKMTEVNSNYICIVSIHYVPLIIDVVSIQKIKYSII